MHNFIKEIKNKTECIVELYKHAGIFKNTREVHREARGFSSVLKNSQVLIYITEQCTRRKFFFLLWNVKEIARAKTRNVSSVHYLWVRDCCKCFVEKYTHALAAQWTRNFQYCTRRSRVQYWKFRVHCEASKCVYLSTRHEWTDSNPFNIQSEYTASDHRLNELQTKSLMFKNKKCSST